MSFHETLKCSRWKKMVAVITTASHCSSSLCVQWENFNDEIIKTKTWKGIPMKHTNGNRSAKENFCLREKIRLITIAFRFSSVLFRTSTTRQFKPSAFERARHFLKQKATEAQCSRLLLQLCSTFDCQRYSDNQPSSWGTYESSLLLAVQSDVWFWWIQPSKFPQ